MKIFYIIFAVMAFLYVGYVYQMDKIDKIVKQDEINNQIANSLEKEFASADKVVVSEEEKNKLNTLPANIYILLAYKSVETDSGITGYPPGSILTKKDNKYFTKNNHILDVKNNEVTNNLETARPYISADFENQLNIIKQNE